MKRKNSNDHAIVVATEGSRQGEGPPRILYPSALDGQSLDLVLQSPDLAHQVGSLVAGDGSGDNGAGDTAGTAEGDLGGNVDVGRVLVLSQEGDVQKNGQGRGVGGKDNNLRGAKSVSSIYNTPTDLSLGQSGTHLGGSSVQGLGGLVRTLLQLAVVAGRLDQVKNFLYVCQSMHVSCES